MNKRPACDMPEPVVGQVGFAQMHPMFARAACASIEASEAGKRSVTSPSVMQASDAWPSPSSASPSFRSAVGEVGPFGVPE